MERERQQGFTLVELAIVLTIIGLLIGGILKGQELIMNARITATIRQVESYRAAAQTFFDTYNGLPGDLASARTRLPGCTDANGCYNGSGDNAVGTDGGSSLTWHTETYPMIDDTDAGERTQFWRHLYLADLITGVNVGTTIAWGESHPKSEYGTGGFQIARADFPGGAKRYFYRMQMEISGALNGGRGMHPMSPTRLAVLDRKFDDGLPNRGDVVAFNPGDPANLCYNPATSQYLIDDSADCLPFFIMGSGY